MAGEHGAHAAVPLAYVPTGHVEEEKLQEVLPWVLYAFALQGRHAVAPSVVEYVPAGQGLQADGAAAPTKVLYVPASQRVQVAIDEAPVKFDHLPAAHGVGTPAPAGQKEPTGHCTCVEMQEPAGQKYPAVHAPSHAEAVRTVAAKPYLPAAHWPDPAAAVAPAVEKCPQATSPLQVADVLAVLEP